MVAPDYGHMVNTNKHNIGTNKSLKMVIIGYYWDKDDCHLGGTYVEGI
jgi:hypothetical protein